MRPVGSKYLLEEVLGRGATGTVWRGQIRDSGDRVAIKVLKEELATDPDVVMRFLRERSVLLRLSHPNIVRVRDLVVEGELLALVMDLVDSPDLHKYLRAHGKFSPAAGALVMAQIADALAASHADGVVHRDLKPANILLEELTSADGRPLMRPLLTDFGIARLADSPGVTRTSEFVGTPAYVAPESAEGRPQTSAVDIYGAGIVLYELVAGRPPFEGETAMAVLRSHLDQEPVRPSGIPDPLWTAIERCLDKEPSRRPSAVSLARALRVVADGVGVHANSAAIAAAAGVASLLVPDLAPTPAQPGAVPPAGAPAGAGDPTQLLPHGGGQGRAPGADDRTNVLPRTGTSAGGGVGGGIGGRDDRTSVLPASPAGPPPSAPPGAAGQQPDGPHPWQSQLRAARDRNEQTEVAYAPVQGPPQRAPRPAQQQQPYQQQQGAPQQQAPYQQQQPQQQPPRQQPQPSRREQRRAAAAQQRPEQPAPPPAARQAPEPRQRRPRQPMRIPGLGCLKGCLTLIVILVVLAVLVWNFTPVPRVVAEGKNWWEAVSDWWDQAYSWVTTIGDAAEKVPNQGGS